MLFSALLFFGFDHSNQFESDIFFYLGNRPEFAVLVIVFPIKIIRKEASQKAWKTFIYSNIFIRICIFGDWMFFCAHANCVIFEVALLIFSLSLDSVYSFERKILQWFVSSKKSIRQKSYQANYSEWGHRRPQRITSLHGLDVHNIVKINPFPIQSLIVWSEWE